MQECPQCRKLFDPVPASGDFCPECADSIRDEFGLPTLFRAAWNRWLNRIRWLLQIISRRNRAKLKDVKPFKESRTGIILSFAAHQIISTWGVAVTVPWLVATGFDFIRLFGKTFPRQASYWILTETGFFPFQIAFALLLGWLLGSDLRRKSMLWVWVLPLAILGYAVAIVPTLTPFLAPPIMQAGINQSRLWHYFGWGCRPDRRCLDQILVTLPFYSAAAYSIGALLAPKMPSNYRTASAVRFWASLILGLVCLACAISLIIQAKHDQSLLRQSIPNGMGGLRWFVVCYELVPLAVGGLLLFFADWMRRKGETGTATDIA